MTNNDDLRDRALASLAAKRKFWYSVVGWAAVSVVLVVIWLLSGGGYFWPVWPIVFGGLGLAMGGFRLFTGQRGGPTEEQIRREERRLS